MRIDRCYSKLVTLPSFRERFEYLKLGGKVGEDTFGFDRFLNQIFYKTEEWLSVRDRVIIRDNACDLGVEGHGIYGKVLIHHMSPVEKDDILYKRDCILDPEYLICVSLQTHNAIHYSNEKLLVSLPVERKPNDTCPWKK